MEVWFSLFHPTEHPHIFEECVSVIWSYGRAIHQVSSMYGGEFLKEGESTYWLKAGSFQTGRHGVSEEDWSSGILNIKNI